MRFEIKIKLIAIVVAAAIVAAIFLSGCSLFGVAKEASTEPVVVTRVPVERPELPLPELPEESPMLTFSVTPTSTTDEARITQELATISASIEELKASTASEIYKISQSTKAEVEAKVKESDVRLAGLEQELKTKDEQVKATTYDSSKWLWAIVSAAIAAIVWCYKKLNLAAALLALGSFSFLFCLILAGQHYAKWLALAPVPFIVLLVYISYRDGLISQALRACVVGIEKGGDAKTKREVSRADRGVGAVERVARKTMDEARLDAKED